MRYVTLSSPCSCRPVRLTHFYTDYAWRCHVGTVGRPVRNYRRLGLCRPSHVAELRSTVNRNKSPASVMQLLQRAAAEREADIVLAFLVVQKMSTSRAWVQQPQTATLTAFSLSTANTFLQLIY